MPQGAGLDELTARLQQGDVLIAQEYSDQAWPQRPTGPIVLRIRRVGEGAEATPPRSARRGLGLSRIGRGALSDAAHHDPVMKWHGIAADGKTFAVAIGPCCTDGRPVGVLAFAVDAVEAVGGFVDSGG
jgi:hypothetical protein